MNWYPAQTIKSVCVIAAMVGIAYMGTKHPEALTLLGPLTIGLLAMAQSLMKPAAETTAAADAHTAAVSARIVAATTPTPAPAAPHAPPAAP